MILALALACAITAPVADRPEYVNRVVFLTVITSQPKAAFGGNTTTTAKYIVFQQRGRRQPWDQGRFGWLPVRKYYVDDFPEVSKNGPYFSFSTLTEVYLDCCEEYYWDGCDHCNQPRYERHSYVTRDFREVTQSIKLNFTGRM